jgi:hypothetical protein
MEMGQSRHPFDAPLREGEEFIDHFFSPLYRREGGFSQERASWIAHVAPYGGIIKAVSFGRRTLHFTDLESKKFVL